MDRESPPTERVESSMMRWATALAVSAAIAVYLALHLRAIATAFVGAFEALRG